MPARPETVEGLWPFFCATQFEGDRVLKRTERRKNRTLNQVKNRKKPAKYRITDEQGNILQTFELSEDRPKVTLHFSLSSSVKGKTVEEYYEDEAWAAFENLMDMLETLKAINPDKAETIFAEMFCDE